MLNRYKLKITNAKSLQIGNTKSLQIGNTKSLPVIGQTKIFTFLISPNYLLSKMKTMNNKLKTSVSLKQFTRINHTLSYAITIAVNPFKYTLPFHLKPDSIHNLNTANISRIPVFVAARQFNSFSSKEPIQQTTIVLVLV